jgi:superfamily II helicase
MAGIGADIGLVSGEGQRVMAVSATASGKTTRSNRQRKKM